MIRATWTVGNVQQHAATLQEISSQLLTGLAAGKYDKEVAFGERVLTEIGIALPPAMMVKQALEVFLEINKMTAPRRAIVSDGQGGFVPENNSKYNPATGEFL